MPRRPSPQPGPGSTSYLDRVRWVEVSNENAEDAPGGALLMVTGGGTDDGDSADDYGVPTVDQPDADGLTGLLVAHPAGIPAGGRGLATSDDFVPVAYDDADTPAVGETWGSAAGSWLLTKDMAGWRVAATAVASQDLKLVECWRDGAAAAVYGELIYATVTLSGASGVYASQGTITLPSAGTYQISYTARGNITPNALGVGGFFITRLAVTTPVSPTVTNMGTMEWCTAPVNGVQTFSTVNWTGHVIVGSPSTINFESGRYVPAGGALTSSMTSVLIVYLKLA